MVATPAVESNGWVKLRTVWEPKIPSMWRTYLELLRCEFQRLNVKSLDCIAMMNGNLGLERVRNDWKIINSSKKKNCRLLFLKPLHLIEAYRALVISITTTLSIVKIVEIKVLWKPAFYSFSCFCNQLGRCSTGVLVVWDLALNWSSGSWWSNAIGEW